MKVLKKYPPKLTQGYSKSHQANDIVGSNNGKSVLDTIVAIDDGEVIQVINNVNVNTNGKDGHKLDTSNGGNIVKIKHNYGYVSRYLHGQYKSVKVKVGDKVKAGTELMKMGNTGYSFGGHLHLDLWLNGTKVDPYDYVFKNKTFNPLPKPVSRDESVEQLQVIEKQLRVRTGHSTKEGILGYCPTGIYNILYTYNDGTYTWYEIEKDKWVASNGKWAVILKAKTEDLSLIEIKPVDEQNTSDNTNTLPNDKNDENSENNQDTDYYDNKEQYNALLWLIQKITELFKKIFNKE